MSVKTGKSILSLKALVLLLALAVMLIPMPFALHLRHDYAVLPLLLCVLGTSAMRRENDLPLFALSLFSFLLLLNGVWASGFSTPFMIGGLIPCSDAGGYYENAQKLLAGGLMSQISANRPFFTSSLSGLLFLFDGLRGAMVAYTLLAALSVFAATRAVRREVGPLLASVFFMLLFLRYRRYAGTVMSEQIGFSIGCWAFAALLEGFSRSRKTHVLLGLFLLSLALNSRAGAFFVLPTVALAAFLTFRRKQDIKNNLQLVVLLVLALLLPFQIGSLLRMLFSESGQSFSNFGHVLYGTLTGGDWTSVYSDHPEVARLAEPEQSRQITEIAFGLLREEPSRFLWGTLRAFREGIAGNRDLFSFVFVRGPEISETMDSFSSQGIVQTLRSYPLGVLSLAACMALFALLHVFSLVAAFFLVKNRRQSVALFILLAVLGTLASLPFATPWDSDNMRAYTASISFHAFVPLFGLFAFAQKIKEVAGENSRHLIRKSGLGMLSARFPDTAGISSPLLVSLFFCILLVFVPILTQGTQTIPLNSRGYSFYLRSGSFLDVGEVKDGGLYSIHPDRFHYNLYLVRRAYPDIASMFGELEAPFSLIRSWTPTEPGSRHIVFPNRPERGRVFVHGLTSHGNDGLLKASMIE